jgi:hypothetical protein
MLLKITETYAPGLALFLAGLVLAAGALIGLLVWSVGNLFRRVSRKKSLIGLGICLLLLGVAALLILV